MSSIFIGNSCKLKLYCTQKHFMLSVFPDPTNILTEVEIW